MLDVVRMLDVVSLMTTVLVESLKPCSHERKMVLKLFKAKTK